ncbi:anti-sigma factor [Sphingobium sp. BHU LFT2]|uniref:anti-sigma factor family protein n=1 Tax=Sphingobium sp. BHU LFT2 TaxID=2807634 RepID=UPI001BE89D65|nr:hypothetical protein [Sphingobium sp. BHU LFT2]MBT2246291.1 anti-sigma factor [Sphingobium sp. BHU LFT2]
MTAPIGEDDLMAWIDGRLLPERRVAVEEYLARHPEQARKVREQSEHRRLISEAWGPVAEEPIPASMRITSIRKRRGPGWLAPLAASLLLGIGFASGWSVKQATMPPRAGIAALANEAGDNFRVFAADTVQPVDMGPERRVALSDWVSRRLGSRIQAPELESAGYAFVGGRLVATSHGPAALFLYRSADGAPLGVFIRPMKIEKNADIQVHEIGGLRGLTWSRRGMGFSVTAPEGSKSLDGLADTVMRTAT